MSLSYGTAASFSARYAGPYGTSTSVKYTAITLSATDWKNAESPYMQEITVTGVSTSSIVNLAADAENLELLAQSACAVYLENDGGVITAVAVGGKPVADLVLMAIIEEGAVAE